MVLRYKKLFHMFLSGMGLMAVCLILYGLYVTIIMQDIYRSPMSLRNLVTTDPTTATNTPTTTTVKVLDEQLINEKIESLNRNLPLTFWKLKTKQTPSTRHNATCAPFPNLYEIEFSNNHWQILNSPNGVFYLFGAYFDDRPQNRLGRTVRVLGMINRIEPKFQTYCQFWYLNRSVPEIVPIIEYKYIWNKKWGNYRNEVFQPYLMACQLTDKKGTEVPDAVSLVTNKCDKSTNMLKIINNRPTDGEAKKSFAVCVKGLDFLDVANDTALSLKLVEWLELLRILGAHHVYMYELQLNQRLKHLLTYYENEEKFVTLSSLTLPGGLPNSPYLQHMYLSNKISNKRQNEIIPYNDCFYRNIYMYRYVVLLDIDEVIMPKIANDWLELLDNRIIPQFLKSKNSPAPQLLPQSFNARNVYFLDDLLHKSHGWFQDIPLYAHMLQHVYRTKNYTKKLQYVKAFHDTEQVVALHNHLPLACFGRVCKSHDMDTEEAQLQHYRADCVRMLKKSCNAMRKETVQDTTIWKFKDQLTKRMSFVAKFLNLL